jgi:TonB family protein
LAYSFCSCLFAAVLSAAAQSTHSSEPVRLGPGVTPPQLIHKVEPEFTQEARAAHFGGTVVLQLVVDKGGLPTEMSVISPLGYGLDEQALAAVAQWRFRPGIKAGAPVKVLAIVEVNFRIGPFEGAEKVEKQRTAYNIALNALNQTNPPGPATERAVETILKLSHEKYPAAMWVEGVWKAKGEHVPKDEAGALELFEKAAAKNHGPAIYEIAVRRLQSSDNPQETEKALQEMNKAATLGSGQAQFYLGNRYEKGDGVQRDPGRAEHYFRLCSARGVAQCQYRLGRLLFDAPDRRERDYLESVALFQLAADQGLAPAKQAASDETAKLDDEQRMWVASLKRQLARK